MIKLAGYFQLYLRKTKYREQAVKCVGVPNGVLRNSGMGAHMTECLDLKKAELSEKGKKSRKIHTGHNRLQVK